MNKVLIVWFLTILALFSCTGKQENVAGKNETSVQSQKQDTTEEKGTADESMEEGQPGGNDARENEKTDPLELLINAIEDNDLEKVRALVESKLDINQLFPPNQSLSGTPLFYAVRENRRDIVDFLLQQGANPNIDSGFAPSAFSMAVLLAKNDLVIQMVEKYGADITKQIPLPDAVSEGNKELVQYFIEKGVNLNEKVYDNRDFNDKGRTPLTIAREKGFTEIERMLLEAGASE